MSAIIIKGAQPAKEKLAKLLEEVKKNGPDTVGPNADPRRPISNMKSGNELSKRR